MQLFRKFTVYIGKTNYSIETHRSGIFDHTACIARQHHYFVRKVREMVQITKHNSNRIRDEDDRLNSDDSPPPTNLIGPCTSTASKANLIFPRTPATHQMDEHMLGSFHSILLGSDSGSHRFLHCESFTSGELLCFHSFPSESASPVAWLTSYRARIFIKQYLLSFNLPWNEYLI